MYQYTATSKPSQKAKAKGDMYDEYYYYIWILKHLPYQNQANKTEFFHVCVKNDLVSMHTHEHFDYSFLWIFQQQFHNHGLSTYALGCIGIHQQRLNMQFGRLDSPNLLS